jgi:hypothetical protein
MKTQILMNEANIDWLAVLADGEEKPIFDILKQSKIQKFDLDVLDSSTNRITFTDYALADIEELTVRAVVKIGGNVEKRKYEFLKKSSGWAVFAEFKGEDHPITMSINAAQSVVDGHVVVDITGNGSGDQAIITIYAQTKLAS